MIEIYYKAAGQMGLPLCSKDEVQIFFSVGGIEI